MPDANVYSNRKEVVPSDSRRTRFRVHRYFLVDTALKWIVAALSIAIAGWAVYATLDCVRIWVEGG